MNKIIQDMIPVKNKIPLREAIPVEKQGKRVSSIKERRTEEVQNVKKTIHSDGIVGERNVRPWQFAVIALVCIGALIYAFSLAYAKATVTITPASIVIPVSGTYTAYEDAVSSSSLSYHIIQTSAQLSQAVPVTIGPIVTTYAKGTIILYDNYSSVSQKIVAGTHLVSGNGLVYTTNSSVIIPGIIKNVPGSVSVNITAAAPGPSYNISTSDLTTNPSYGDFNIVAYKGTSKYTGFYGRLNPAGFGIEGGSSGHQLIISSSTLTTANQQMQIALQESLLSKSQSLIPAGSLMFNNAYTIAFTPIMASTTSSTTATIGMLATFSGITFNKNALAQTIAPTQYNDSFNPEDLDSAIFTITNPQAFTPTNNAPLNFNLKGTMDLVGIIATSSLADQLDGISMAQSVSVFKNYSAIATVHATILPFWKHSFPSSPSRINIVIQP